MDLEELRGALGDAARTPGIDTASARETVGGRARGLRRRRRVVTSAVALVCVAAVVVGAVAVFGREPTHRSIDIAPPGGRMYDNLPSRLGAAIAYDDARGNVVLFGGRGRDGDLAETWLWDGTGWSQAKPAAAPAAREGAVMTYDAVAHQVVLFGGTQRRAGNATTIILNDTWTWDGTTWTERHPAHVPPVNTPMAMSYDPRSKSLLLMTFEFTSAALPSDTPLPFATWRWDGADWLHLSTPTAPIYTTSGNPDHFVPYLTPLPSGAGLLYYAWARSGTSQTWTWDGTRWTEEHPVHTPVRGTFVTTPGPGAAPTIFLPERGIWRWTGSDWTKTERSGIGSNGDGFAVYDAHDSNVVVYANRAGYGLIYDTWTWDGTWTERVRSLSPPTTTRLATTTTIAPPTDPLPAGSVMLSTSGRTISAVDATGHVLKKLVTAFAGRSVMNAQLMADHQTIWYATKADDNQTCPEIVKLDLQTNARTVVAHALDFAITEDGSKLLLVYPYSNALVTNQCRPVPLAPGTSSYADDLSVRNLSTGAQSALPNGAYPSAGTGGPTGHVWISPSGEELIASNCVADGCVTMTFTVPKDLNGPIVPDRTKPGPKCGCSTLVSGPDGVYGVDEGSWNDARNFFRRYDATNLTGTGAEVLAPKSGTLGSVAPSAAGVFVTGRPTGSTTGVLYRVANGALEVVGPLATDVGHIYPIPPYVAG